MENRLEEVYLYHQNLPPETREYLRVTRGLTDETIDQYLLGWNGERITIPIFDRESRFAFFKLAKAPGDRSDAPKMLTEAGSHAELYGWERVISKSEELILCEGEFDRLALESRGFPAICSTGGAGTFRADWAAYFQPIKQVYIVFDKDRAGRTGADKAARLIPHAKIFAWPEYVEEGTDVTDFFVTLRRGEAEFRRWLSGAREIPIPVEMAEDKRTPKHASSPEVQELKASVCIEEIVSRSVKLVPSGATLVGLCPFHADHAPSFTVYPVTQSFHCFGCGKHGDVLTFLMENEMLTFTEALAVLRELNP